MITRPGTTNDFWKSFHRRGSMSGFSTKIVVLFFSFLGPEGWLHKGIHWVQPKTDIAPGFGPGKRLRFLHEFSVNWCGDARDLIHAGPSELWLLNSPLALVIHGLLTSWGADLLFSRPREPGVEAGDAKSPGRVQMCLCRLRCRPREGKNNRHDIPTRVSCSSMGHQEGIVGPSVLCPGTRVRARTGGRCLHLTLDPGKRPLRPIPS